MRYYLLSTSDQLTYSFQPRAEDIHGPVSKPLVLVHHLLLLVELGPAQSTTHCGSHSASSEASLSSVTVKPTRVASLDLAEYFPETTRGAT